MLKRLKKMISKVKDDFRIKQARTEFEKRHMKNQRVAMYRQKRMLEVSKQLREKLNETDNSSGADYFAVLKEIYISQGRSVYGGALRKKPRKEINIEKEGINNVGYKNEG